MPHSHLSIDKRKISTTGINKGKYHIKLFLTFQIPDDKGKLKRVIRPYKTGLYATLDEYRSMWNIDKPTKKPDLIKIRAELNAIKAKADSILKEQNIRDQKSFELFFLTEHNIALVRGQFELMIKKQQKISTVRCYKDALNSFLNFSHENLTFQEITPDFLQRYQAWYVAPPIEDEEGKIKGKIKSLTSVGINCRHLRAVFNQAIRLRVIPPEIYPFGKDRFVIPQGGREVQIFLTSEQKNQFLNYKPQTEQIAKYYNYAIFDYFANGINFADIASLKHSSVYDEHIIVVRQKTEGRMRSSKKIIIPIHPRMREVIQKLGNKTLDPQEYVFPIFKKEMTTDDLNRVKQLFIKATNRILEVIRQDLKIPIKITTYTLRHTFSAMMLEMGATTEHLQDSLGHGDAKTTESYKHGFSLGLKKKFSEGL